MPIHYLRLFAIAQVWLYRLLASDTLHHTRKSPRHPLPRRKKITGMAPVSGRSFVNWQPSAPVTRAPCRFGSICYESLWLW
jgi:hypothetical protein